MKKTLIALAVLASSASAFATCGAGSCTVPGVTGSGASVKGTNTVVSGSSASVTASGAGSSSTSFASNTTTATTTTGVTAVGTYQGQNCDPVNAGSVGVTGSVALKSETVAYNVSTGAGANGTAAAGGLATGSVTGTGAFVGGNTYGGITGAAQGSTSASLASGVLAGRNGGAQEIAVAGGSFAVNAGATLSVDGTCAGGKCTANSDTKTATTSVLASAYSDKATYAVGGVSLSNAVAGSIVNASAGGNAVAGGVAVVGGKVTVVDSDAKK